MPRTYDPEARAQWLREVVSMRQAEAVKAIRLLGGAAGTRTADPITRMHDARYAVQVLYGAVLDLRTARRREGAR